jgi:tRNA pseudouridine55 synthase
MPPRALRPSGLVLADKPEGPSSFAVVRRLRNATGARAGHAGTLDPLASGLLLVLLGAATRLARYLVGLDKRYVTEVDLTARTATGDREGHVVEERDAPAPGELERRLSDLRGSVELRVPAASAVKVAGERAYRLARRGVGVEMPVRSSTVHRLDVVAYDGRVARLDLDVSSGTYIRAIADALGGHCRSLRRLEVGPFGVGDADERRILAAAAALPFLPSLEVSRDDARAIRAGRPVRGAGTGRVRLVHGGELVAVAVARPADGRLVPETVMPA